MKHELRYFHLLTTLFISDTVFLIKESSSIHLHTVTRNSDICVSHFKEVQTAF